MLRKLMKKHIMISLMAVVFLTIGCSKPDIGEKKIDPPFSPSTPEKPAEEQIVISSAVDVNPVLSSEGGESKINFTSTASWTASVVSTRTGSWVDVNPKSGNSGSAEIVIKVTANDTYEDRNATIQIKCGSATKDVVLTQNQLNNITIATDKVELGAEGGSFTIVLKTNIDFNYEISGEWIKYVSTRSYVEKILTFTAEANAGLQRREGSIIIRSGEFSETVKVYQDGEEPILDISQDEYSLEADGGSINVEVSSNLPIKMAIPSEVEWISENRTRSVSTSTFHLDVAENNAYEPRSAEIIFSNELSGVSEKVIVNQKGKVFIHVTSVILDKTSVAFKVGESVTLTATVSPDDATDKTVTWSTSDETVATVSSNGVVAAKKIGISIITAKAGDKTATCIINVEPISVTEVILDRSSLTMVEDEVYTLNAEVKPDNATNKKVIWSSSNSAIAKVENGTVTALKAGESLIIVKTEDREKIATCKVIVNKKGNLENPDEGEKWEWN